MRGCGGVKIDGNFSPKMPNLVLTAVFRRRDFSRLYGLVAPCRRFGFITLYYHCLSSKWRCRRNRFRLLCPPSGSDRRPTAQTAGAWQNTNNGQETQKTQVWKTRIWRYFYRRIVLIMMILMVHLFRCHWFSERLKQSGRLLSVYISTTTLHRLGC